MAAATRELQHQKLPMGCCWGLALGIGDLASRGSKVCSIWSADGAGYGELDNAVVVVTEDVPQDQIVVLAQAGS